ncbi:MAG: DUF4041 domain-containing protein, partial [Synergistaceae bacterium]|nr:DUF4041 domain-containing protein [Synergistaceae bacterium]
KNAEAEAKENKEKSDSYSRTAEAMKNLINGYCNDYIVPSNSLLDGLADTYGYTQASEDYKKIRAHAKSMIKTYVAADCDYTDKDNRQVTINFILDAFNGKFDSIISDAKADNFGTLKQKLIDAYNLVNYNGQVFGHARITEEYFDVCMKVLRLACVLNEIRKKDIEEQRRIKEQIREEEKIRREIEKTRKEAEKEEAMLQKAMEQARAQLNEANAEQRALYENQIADLEQKLHEAEERNQRAISMAQQTKSGHVYIISNEGSFGADVFKIGMTRRLEPFERIRELSGASVPFPFDVHAMIWSEDAPALETELHKKFALYQVNKVNARKEFFRVPLSEIKAELENENLEIKWTIKADAAEYRETLAIEKAIKDNDYARDSWLKEQFNEKISANGLDENE